MAPVRRFATDLPHLAFRPTRSHAMTRPPVHHHGSAARLAGFGPAHRALLSPTALCLGMQPPTAQATQYTHVGKVAKVYSLDCAHYGSPVDHFKLQGFTQAGACLTNDAVVAVVQPDDEGGRGQLAVVLIARAMDWTLHVRVNDERTTPGSTYQLQVLEVER